MAAELEGTLDSLGTVEMSGIKLNKPTKDLLDLNWATLDVHVAMHPAAIAYYGAYKKEAMRNLATMKRAYDRWYKKMWTEAKVKACGGVGPSAQYKPTVNDIEARLIVDHEKELEDWDERLDRAQKHQDDLDSWFEAWRQKSFAMRDHVALDEEDRWAAGGGSIKGAGGSGDGDGNGRPEINPDRMRRVKDIIRKRREAQTGASV
jgi:hypothetical protein